MESLDFTDDEIKVRVRECRKLETLCRDRGETGPADHYAAVLRALEAEARDRNLEL